MREAGLLADLEAPAVPPAQLERLLALYDASLEELERLDDPGLGALIGRLQRRREWARDLLAARGGRLSLNGPL